MTKEELMQKIASLNEEEKVRFYLGSQKASSRFDKQDIHQYEEADCVTDIAFVLYSYIASAIIIKAQTGGIRKDGQEQMKQELKKHQAVNLDACLACLADFWESKGKISLLDLTEALLPSACQESKKKYSDNEIEKACLKSKGTIVNQVVLFTRSLYRSFLSQKGIDPQSLLPDYSNLGNGLFLYQGQTLYVSTWQNAFTLASYQKVIHHALGQLSDLPLDKINKIAVIYLSKDIIGIYNFTNENNL